LYAAVVAILGAVTVATTTAVAVAKRKQTKKAVGKTDSLFLCLL